jgi:hypothetical protein
MDTTTATSNNDQSNPPTTDIETLRVADQELLSGNTAGRVFVRLSPGAAPILMERPVAQARVSRQLRAAIDADPASSIQ